MTQLANGVENHKTHSTAWKRPVCVSEPTVALVPAFTAVPSRSGGAAGPLAHTCTGHGPALWSSSSEEQSSRGAGRKQSRAGAMKRLSRRGGSQGERGSSWGRQLTTSPACAWGPRSAAAAAPLARSMAGSSPWEMGGKAGSTWVLLPLH